MLDKAELAEVAEAIASAAALAAVKALQEAKFISDSDHHIHHTWISAKIKNEEARSALYEELTKHVAKWGTVGLLSAVFYGLWLVLQLALKK